MKTKTIENFNPDVLQYIMVNLKQAFEAVTVNAEGSVISARGSDYSWSLVSLPLDAIVTEVE